MEEMKLNEIPVFNGFQSQPGGYKRDYAYLYLDRQATQENNLESIRELSVRFQIRSEDYTEGSLYRTDTLYYESAEGDLAIDE